MDGFLFNGCWFFLQWMFWPVGTILDHKLVAPELRCRCCKKKRNSLEKKMSSAAQVFSPLSLKITVGSVVFWPVFFSPEIQIDAHLPSALSTPEIRACPRIRWAPYSWSYGSAKHYVFENVFHIKSENSKTTLSLKRPLCDLNALFCAAWEEFKNYDYSPESTTKIWLRIPTSFTSPCTRIRASSELP